MERRLRSGQRKASPRSVRASMPRPKDSNSYDARRDVNGLKLRWELRRLRRQHQTLPAPCIIPLSAPTPTAMVLEGHAAACDDVDLANRMTRSVATAERAHPARSSAAW